MTSRNSDNTVKKEELRQRITTSLNIIRESPIKDLLRDVLTSMDDKPDISWIAEEFKLAPKEHEIIQLLVDGKTPRQISELFGTKFSTVRNQIHKAHKKMGVTGMTELMSMLIQGPRKSTP